MVICLDCGHFQPGVVRDGAIEAIAERCERCGESSFEEAAVE